MADYDKRAQELNDEDYKNVEVDAVDVKEIQNTPLGVYGFWLRAMLNHGAISRMIQEKDRTILKHLQNIEYTLHDSGYGFDLVFTFENNDYFSNTELKKRFVMSKQNIIEKCEGTEINWKAGKDVTKKKVKKNKKKKNAKGGAGETKTVDAESFFNFFKTLNMPDEEQLKKGEAHAEEEEKDIGEKMDIDYDLGNEFKDQLIPLALEYYMEVIDEDDEDDEEGCESGDDRHRHHGGKGGKDSDDEDDQPKGKKKPAKKGGNAAGP